MESEYKQPNRRDWLARMAAVSASVTLIGGCDRSDPSGDGDASGVVPTIRADVPLRILFAGEPAAADAMKLAWSMSMVQPLEIEVLSREDFRELATGNGDAFAARMNKVDVAILPQWSIGLAAEADLIVPVGEAAMSDYTTQYGKPFPAVKNGLGAYGGQSWGIPVGAKLFALLTLDSDEVCQTWSQYHDRVVEASGAAAEPLAPSWAAASYLNRCASQIQRGWLFRRADLTPELTGDDYVAVLEQLAETASQYKQTALDPTAIWKLIRSGELQFAIGYESPIPEDAEVEAQEVFDVQVLDPPGETETDRVWFPPRTPVAFLSVGCRQTDASKRLIGWLLGGEQIQSLRRASEQLSLSVRDVKDDVPSVGNAYSNWLAKRLETLQVIPSMTLPGSEQYYDALDAAVLQCIAGDVDAKTALVETSRRWEAITESFGREAQLTAWKRTLGFGG